MLGSINPQIVMPQQALKHSAAIASALCQAMLQGRGQFCSSPELWLIATGCDNLVT
ncbi:hypothetical protein [Pseudoalteromonas sp.]|uniref:hypothetical protein n=1 Tax=Pseudoalteromonas sp. TaxID=53249 RepID=UPI003565BEC8